MHSFLKNIQLKVSFSLNRLIT